MAKKKGKKKKGKKMKFTRAPSKLPADRVLKSNQYLHIQRQLDELRGAPLAKTRGDRGADYVRAQGLPLVSNVINVGSQGTTAVKSFQSLTASEKEALDKMRDEPDILKGIHRKQVNSALKSAQKKEKAATAEWEAARHERDRLGASRAKSPRDRRPTRGGGTPLRPRRSSPPPTPTTGQRTSSGTGATALFSKMEAAKDLESAEKPVAAASRKGRREAFKNDLKGSAGGGSVWAHGASTSPQTNFGWEGGEEVEDDE